MTPFDVEFRRADESEFYQLTAGEEFRVDMESYERLFQKHLPARLVDLLRIASGVYVVDRLLTRRPRTQQRYWSRSLVIRIGVLEPGFWMDEAVREALTEILQFLSDDTWQIEFFKDDRVACKKIQHALFEVPNNSLIALYSGGLDSAAGLVNRIAGNPSRSIVPTVVWHQPIQRKIVNAQFKSLMKNSENPIAPLIVKAAILWSSEMKQLFRGESSQRSRAFLFCTAGAVAAAMNESDCVELLESGIGAINLPLMSGMVGSKTTKSTHPYFINMMSKLLGMALQRPFTFKLPLLSFTKAQVVQNAVNLGHDYLLKQTISCVHFPLRESKHKQCGLCPACIFRRQSISVGGSTEDSGIYKHDFLTDPTAANQIDKANLQYLRAFMNQIIQLDELKPNLPIPLIFKRHLIGTGILKADESSDEVKKLLVTYREEWKSLIAWARNRGLNWANLIGQDARQTEGATHAVA